ncbi:hypothetical protein [Rufibacter soli]
MEETIKVSEFAKAENEMLDALKALYLAVDKPIADDVKTKVIRAYDMAKGQAPMLNTVGESASSLYMNSQCESCLESTPWEEIRRFKGECSKCWMKGVITPPFTAHH